MMKSACMWVGLGLALASMSAAAQTVTGSGTTNSVPVFTGTSTIGNSPITVSGGNVGIGTTAPASLFDVFGSASFGVPTFGENGLGTDGKFQILTGGASPIADRLVFGTDNSGWRMAISKNSAGTITDLMTVIDNGNVGIGTTAPGKLLDVAGTIRTSANTTTGDSGGVIFPDGTTQNTAFIPANCGADYAESVGVSGDRTAYEPGDILVIDPNAPGKFLKSNQAYSTLVAGIYSTMPGFVGRLQPETAETKATEVPMAMVGRVPTKVSAENGPIKVGDLLVSSSTVGYAMKGTDRRQMLGAVIGKALGSLDSGTGVVMVLATLQ